MELPCAYQSVRPEKPTFDIKFSVIKLLIYNLSPYA
jgi:hypothetical protein